MRKNKCSCSTIKASKSWKLILATSKMIREKYSLGHRQRMMVFPESQVQIEQLDWTGWTRPSSSLVSLLNVSCYWSYLLWFLTLTQNQGQDAQKMLWGLRGCDQDSKLRWKNNWFLGLSANVQVNGNYAEVENRLGFWGEEMATFSYF